MSDQNRQIVFVRRPTGLPGPDVFRHEDILRPTPADGELLLRTLYLSVDPYMRGRMNDAKSYTAPFELGQPFTGSIVAEVMESKHSGFQAGDIVAGMGAWREFQTVAAGQVEKVDPRMPLSACLGVFGMPGVTAYIGVDLCEPRADQTFVVSAAAGAVGSVAGQIARIKGCRVVGLTGSAEKVAYLKELGFTEAIDYKTGDLAQKVRQACPDGVDMYFDNVGGAVTEAVLSCLNPFARIALCGQISTYNGNRLAPGPNWAPLLTDRVKLQGFIVTDHLARWQEARDHLIRWVNEGKVRYRETVVEGFDRVPEAFLGLFRGDNIGKLVVKVADRA